MTGDPVPESAAGEVQVDSRVIPTPVFVGLLVLAALLVVLSVYVWGQRAFNVLSTVGFLGLLVMHLVRERRDEDTRADVDEALRGVEDLKAFAFGLPQPSTGRHVHPDDGDRYPTRSLPRTDSSWRSA